MLNSEKINKSITDKIQLSVVSLRKEKVRTQLRLYNVLLTAKTAITTK